MSNRFAVPEHVIERALGEKTILLNLRSGDYYSLNPVGSFFWKGLVTGRTAEDLTVSAAETYSQPVAVIEADFAAFTSELAELGLLERV
jgi:hypothetical protein